MLAEQVLSRFGAHRETRMMAVPVRTCVAGHAGASAGVWYMVESSGSTNSAGMEGSAAAL